MTITHYNRDTLKHDLELLIKEKCLDNYEQKIFITTNFAVCKVFNVKEDILNSGLKIINKRQSFARMVAWYIYKKLTGDSSRILSKFYKINHVTICNSVHYISFLKKSKDPKIQEDLQKINFIEQLLKTELSLYKS